MKQEDDDLLIKDLCARLPYRTKVQMYDELINCTYDSYLDTTYIRRLLIASLREDIKPYLFPMSAMTEEQKKEYHHILYDHYCFDSCIKTIDWLNEHHFDYRNLIDRDLAIDCTNLNIY